jgi:hypothetical protein
MLKDYSKKLQKRIEYLFQLEKKLRTLVHKPGCKNIYECPQMHDCSDDLNEATACYWVAAETISIVSDVFTYEEYLKSGRYRTEGQLEALLEVLHHHLHNKQNHRAYHIIRRALAITQALNNWIDSKRKYER